MAFVLTALKNQVFLTGEEILRNADNDTSGGYAAAYAFVVLRKNTGNAGLRIT